MPGSGPDRLLSLVNYRPHTKHPNVFLRLCSCKLEWLGLMIIMIIALCPGPGLCNPSCITWLMRDGNCNINTINTAQTSDLGNNNIISAGQMRLDTTQPCTRGLGFLLANLLANISSVRWCRLSMAGYLLYLNNCGPGV